MQQHHQAPAAISSQGDVTGTACTCCDGGRCRTCFCRDPSLGVCWCIRAICGRQSSQSAPGRCLLLTESHRITENAEMEGTQQDHRVHLLALRRTPRESHSPAEPACNTNGSFKGTGVFSRRLRRLAAAGAAGAGARTAASGQGGAPLPARSDGGGAPGTRGGRSALTSLLGAYPGAPPAYPCPSRPIPGPLPPSPTHPGLCGDPSRPLPGPLPSSPAHPGLARGLSRLARHIPAYPGAHPA